MITNLHHVAILTSNMGEAIKRYTTLLGCQLPKVAAVNMPGVKLRTAMLPVGTTGGTYLQLIEPVNGPGVDELRQGGEGTLFEVGFQVDDIEDFHQQLDCKGITPVDLLGQSIAKSYIESKFGNRYFYLPKDVTGGTRFEMVQVMG